MLGFSLDGIPGKLGCYVVDHFDFNEMVLHVRNFSIPITAQTVHEVLGAPNGPNRLEDFEPDYLEENCVVEFKALHGKDNVTPNDVVRYICSTTSADWDFKMNFLVLMANIFGESMANGSCNLHVLYHIGRGIDISQIDWCGYIIECLSSTKKSWNKDNPQSKYCGLLTFLTVLYLHTVNCSNYNFERQLPAVRGWTMERISQRERVELGFGGLGFGDMNPLLMAGSEGHPLSLCGPELRQEADAEKQEQQVSTLEASVQRIDEAIKKLEESIEDALQQFPKDVDIEGFRSRCEEMFSKFMSAKDPNSPLQEEENVDDVIDRSLDVVNKLAGYCDFTPPDFILIPSQSVQLSLPVSDQISGDREQTTKREKERKFEAEKKEGREKGEWMVDGLNQEQENVDASAQAVEWEEQREVGEETMKIEKERKFEAKKKEAREKGEGMVDGLNQEQENVDDSAQAVEWEEQREVGEEENEEKEDRIVGKRQQKLSAELKSPYMSRGVEIKTSLTMLERKVSRALFSMRKDKYDVIYETGFGFLCMRATLETLLSSEYVSYDVFDNFGQLLNYEEQFRSKGSIHRFYCTTTFLPYVIHKDEDTTDAGRYEISKFELENLLQKHNQPMSLQRIDMIFFPILQDKHFWVAACDLRRPTFLILDNSACGLGAPIKDKYIGMPESLCYCLAEYMKSVSHPKAIEMESVEIERADMSYRTKENKIDCGVFVMRHMESYKGQRMKSWDCELGIEGFHQQQALNKLRSKYATKMLMSNANLQKKKVLDEANEFALFSKVEQDEILAVARQRASERFND